MSFLEARRSERKKMGCSARFATPRFDSLDEDVEDVEAKRMVVFDLLWEPWNGGDARRRLD